MTRRVFSREFKREAVELMAKRGVSAVHASWDLGIHAPAQRQGDPGRRPISRDPFQLSSVGSNLWGASYLA